MQHTQCSRSLCELGAHTRKWIGHRHNAVGRLAIHEWDIRILCRPRCRTYDLNFDVLAWQVAKELHLVFCFQFSSVCVAKRALHNAKRYKKGEDF